MPSPLEKLRAAIEYQLAIRQFGIPRFAIAAGLIDKRSRTDS